MSLFGNKKQLSLKLSKNGFTQNSSNVWGHCEEYELMTTDHVCTDQTRYRCDTCGCFVCHNHQPRHRRGCPVKGTS